MKSPSRKEWTTLRKVERSGRRLRRKRERLKLSRIRNFRN
jgi:hypothetical protein